jgi:hypothetical protein
VGQRCRTFTPHVSPVRWRRADSNRRPPACKAGALPTELLPRGMQETWQKSRPGSSIRGTSSVPSTRSRGNHAPAPAGRLPGMTKGGVDRSGVDCVAVLTASRAGMITQVTSRPAAAQHLRGFPRLRRGDAVVRGEVRDQADQEPRSAGHRAAPRMTAMDIQFTRASSPARRPGRIPGLLSRPTSPTGIRDCAFRDLARQPDPHPGAALSRPKEVLRNG